MKYLAKFIITKNRSYMTEIEFPTQNIDSHDFHQHPAVCNEIEKNKNITKVEFYKANPDFTINISSIS